MVHTVLPMGLIQTAGDHRAQCKARDGFFGGVTFSDYSKVLARNLEGIFPGQLSCWFNLT